MSHLRTRAIFDSSDALATLRMCVHAHIGGNSDGTVSGFEDEGDVLGGGDSDDGGVPRAVDFSD